MSSRKSVDLMINWITKRNKGKLVQFSEIYIYVTIIVEKLVDQHTRNC